MSATVLERPSAEEHIPYFGQYIQQVPDGDILDILARQIPETLADLARLSDEQSAWRPAPGEWSATDIVGHLADTERILGYRTLRLARRDATLPEGVEFEEYAAAANYSARDLASVAAEFATVRAATLAFLRGLDSDTWNHRAPDAWSIRSVRASAWILAGHEIHHMRDIRRILSGDFEGR